MTRRRTNRSRDRKVFKHTAISTNTMNLKTVPRGGIRL